MKDLKQQKYKINITARHENHSEKRNKRERKNVEKETTRNKFGASGVSITSTPHPSPSSPLFFSLLNSTVSRNSSEQLHSGAEWALEGAIKYKLYHITLYVPAEPFGYN